MNAYQDLLGSISGRSLAFGAPRKRVAISTVTALRKMKKGKLPQYRKSLISRAQRGKGVLWHNRQRHPRKPFHQNQVCASSLQALAAGICGNCLILNPSGQRMIMPL
jgi:hypothetical protein